MSFHQLPDEALGKILRLALISEDSITTSIRAHNIYQTFLDSIKVVKELPSVWEERHLDTHLPKLVARRKLTNSPLLLGTCRRWYRLGAPLFYSSNTFVTIHRDLGTFAKQITYHNSQLVQSVELVVRHDDPDPAPKISWLRKAYFRQVRSVNVIIAKRHTVKREMNETLKAVEWVKFNSMMKKKARSLWQTMEKQKRQGGHWKVVGHAWSGLLCTNGTVGISSWICALEKLPIEPRLLAKNKAVYAAKATMQAEEEDTAMSEVDIPDGSVASEENSIEVEAEVGETAIMDAAMPTPEPSPDTTPETLPETLLETLPETLPETLSETLSETSQHWSYR